jgi:predicted AAA+ superfamily ATPase
MAHLRNRYGLNLIKKRLAYSPILAIQGPRQCGKSFLAKRILAEDRKDAVYRTFDQSGERNLAQKSPESYLAQYADAHPLIIDEAQKSPDIFDALKLSVDSNRRPGRFIILGSTEFSRLNLIRESLTGRMSRVRLYPFTLAESRHTVFDKRNYTSSLNNTPRATRKELMLYLNRGGFPGIFTANNQAYRRSLLKDWIDLTVERDIHTFPRIKADSSLARTVLEGIAQLEHPDLPNLARFCGRDSRIVARHLELLLTLFVIIKLEPHQLSTGKPIYFLCDVALVQICGGDLRKTLQTFALLELLAKNEYAETERRYSYFRNHKGSVIDIIESEHNKLTAIKILQDETVDTRQFSLLTALKLKVPNLRLLALGPSTYELKNLGVKVLPWEAVG